MREKSGAFSGSDNPRLLGEDAQFLQALLHRPLEPAPKASVEGLQEMARVRLCLDRAADIPLSFGKARASPPSAPAPPGPRAPLFGNSGVCGGLAHGPLLLSRCLILYTCFTSLASETVSDSPLSPGADRFPLEL